MDRVNMITLQAPAKINLTLHILGKRADGYHELSTRMQKVSLADEITLSLRHRPGICLSCSTKEVPDDASNLAWKAAALFLKTFFAGREMGVAIRLNKKIPVAAGLGGGSSDAGTVLKGLNSLLDAGVSEERLLELAGSLGADVPFFVTDHGAVLATGVGEKMTGVTSLENCSILLVNPGFSVSTRWVYENYTLTRADKTFKRESFQKNPVDFFHLNALHNDLEKVTLRRFPQIQEIKEVMTRMGAAGVLMSGSGPTVFGIFRESGGKSDYNLKAIAATFQRQYGEKVFITGVSGWGVAKR